jgi:UDP-glucoronosyl and UDP-glucosyl transferase
MTHGLRVLVSSVPAPGHLLPLLPLCRALVDAGDDVLVVGPASTVRAANAVGLATIERGGEMAEWFAALAARTRGEPGNGLAPERVIGYFVPRLFGEVGAEEMIDVLLDAIDEFRPDVIYYDTMNVAAPLAASCQGLLGVHHSISLLPEPGLLDSCADAISPLWCAFDQRPAARCGLFDGMTLSTWPASIDILGDCYDGVQRIGTRPRPPSFGDELERWFGGADLPLVYATLGTTTNGDVAVLRAVVDAIVDQPINVVVTVGTNNDPAALGLIPKNAHIEQFIPQARLLPHCALVVSHGGSGTVLGALAHGLPQLIIPQGADQFVNGQCIARHGLGRCESSPHIGPDDIRTHVVDLLGGVDGLHSVRAVRDELAAAPGVEHAVEMTHQAVGAGRSAAE